MAELTDLEKLKQEVENLKKYLRSCVGCTDLLCDELYNKNWEESKKIICDYNQVLVYTANDLFNDNNINNYIDRVSGGEEDLNDLLKIMEENSSRKIKERGREIGETIKMSKQDFSVSKGGKRKTRKNRKSRK